MSSIPKMGCTRAQAETNSTVFQPAPACDMVIFGAGGDLTKRLVTPSLYSLAASKMLPDDFRVVGVDIADLDTESWRKQLTDMIHSFIGKKGVEFETDSIDEDAWKWLMDRFTYVKGDFSDSQTFKNLGQSLRDGNRLFYLAVADRFFAQVIEQLGSAGLTEQKDEGPWRRVIVEKPFGHDLGSAQDLNKKILGILKENQVYRIDHFLGKETVQNIMMMRFGNGVFENLWNNHFIEHVQITAAETVGVEKRGGFYDHAGALRDMVPNHLFQLLAVTAMEPPVSFDADAVRSEKAKVLQAVRLMAEEDVADNAVRGQYGPGTVKGADVQGYRSELNVDPHSATETFVAIKLMIDNWRWGKTPFYLRTGKHMSERCTEIVLQFRRPPFTLFRDTGIENLPPNQIVIRISPNDGMSIDFNAKVPGPTVQVKQVSSDFRYSDFFERRPTTGYETLIYDCMIGDATLFQRADFVEAGWRIVQPILDAWARQTPAFPNYASGSNGPKEADDLLAKDGFQWRDLNS
ncbi:glucose-6-phosphate dehydrogenase [Granulibacter bethesdensis]|uniref:glucose-6-phosphate dehydrogenase n=1 Tax=Granulibacter bethesdensis TaxID=364410 RepID=UPI00090A9976|nr:glucose-6-phosphate dehydrogenase [Granulibacter bethesdensis]APH59182.1 Glucose-6-phosphate 1-dehydrogenase [Granulibacter bethesdensis]